MLARTVELHGQFVQYKSFYSARGVKYEECHHCYRDIGGIIYAGGLALETAGGAQRMQFSNGGAVPQLASITVKKKLYLQR
jgi:hypothetical protein